MTSNGEPYHRLKYKAIIQDQVLLGYLSKGGITYGDTENMTPYERKIAMDTIREAIDAQNKAMKDQQQLISSQSTNDPKSRLTSV